MTRVLCEARTIQIGRNAEGRLTMTSIMQGRDEFSASERGRGGVNLIDGEVEK